MTQSLAAAKSDPMIQAGTPCFAGTRVPIQSLFDYLARGRALDYFLEQFPSVQREQAIDVLSRAGELVTAQAREPQVA